MIHRYFFDMVYMFSIYLAADFGLGPFELALLLWAIGSGGQKEVREDVGNEN